MCSPAPTAQTALQPMVPPTVMLVPQQTMPIRSFQSTPDFSSGDVAAVTTDPTNSNNGVWEGMAAWKAGQSGMDHQQHQWMGKENRSQFDNSNQNSVRPWGPRGKNAISKKPADKSNSVGPRAVFVDLSKIVPTDVLG